MKGVAVIRYLQANNASLIAVVPAASIYAGPIPLNATLPAIGVRQVSAVERLTASMADSKPLRTERVQATVHAASYAQAKAIMALVRTACAHRRGTVNGISVDSILPDGEGPDLFDDAASIHEQSRDFLVRWRE